MQRDYLLRVFHRFFVRLVRGIKVVLANQGVAEMLIINLKGNNAFVMTYAVANLVSFISLYNLSLLYPKSPGLV